MLILHFEFKCKWKAAQVQLRKFLVQLLSADPCLRQGRGGAWDRRRREACRWLCTGFALAIENWACHRFFGRLGHKVIGLTAFNPDVWPPSKAFRQGKLATGSAMGVTTRLFIVFRQVLPQWVSLKPWLVTVFRQALGDWFNGFQSGRLAAFKGFPAG